MRRYDTDAPAPTLESAVTYYRERIESIRDAEATKGTAFTPEQLAAQLLEAETELIAQLLETETKLTAQLLETETKLTALIEAEAELATLIGE